MQKPIINHTYLLEKFPGKGGWTYIVISEIHDILKGPKGIVRVKGSIDDVEISQYNLMPIKNGGFFFPVKAEIRKKIQKKEGDRVKVVLYPDNSPIHIPEELELCLQDASAYEVFLSYPESEQKMFIQWIYSAKTDLTKVSRMAQTVHKVANRQKFYDKV